MSVKAVKASSAVNQPIKIKRALLSVSDKNGIEEFAKALAGFGVDLLSTGGTASLLAKSGLNVTEVSDHTGFPEIMDGRVKTLHPKIHGGILARRDEASHLDAMKTQGITDIDMVVINLYPFVKTVEGGADFANCVENIDIGGPAMIRAAAKNHDFVTVITSAEDYERVLNDMKANNGAVTYETRRQLAANAFALTAAYDSNISNWLACQIDAKAYPRNISMTGNLKQVLRYGENPHQSAALYTVDGLHRPGAALAQFLQGKELSYNNLNDTNAAFELVSEFSEPTVASNIAPVTLTSLACISRTSYLLGEFSVCANFSVALTKLCRWDPCSISHAILASLSRAEGKPLGMV